MRGAGWVIILLVAVAPVGARALCPTPEGSSAQLASAEPRARLAFIQGQLSRDGTRARIWSWGWGAGFTAVGVASVTLGIISKVPGDKVDFLAGGIPAFLPPLVLLVMPLKVMGDSRDLDQRVQGLSADADVCPVLADAEQWFKADAENEHAGMGWFPHVGAVVVNLAVLLIEGLGYGRWLGGAINAAAGMALAELQVWTQPRRLSDDYRRYLRGELPSQAPRLSVFLAPAGPGLGLVMGAAGSL